MCRCSAAATYSCKLSCGRKCAPWMISLLLLMACLPLSIVAFLASIVDVFVCSELCGQICCYKVTCCACTSLESMMSPDGSDFAGGAGGRVGAIVPLQNLNVVILQLVCRATYHLPFPAGTDRIVPRRCGSDFTQAALPIYNLPNISCLP